MAEDELSRDLPFDVEDTYEAQGKALRSRLGDLRKFVDLAIEDPEDTPDRVEIDVRDGQYQIKTYSDGDEGI